MPGPRERKVSAPPEATPTEPPAAAGSSEEPAGPSRTRTDQVNLEVTPEQAAGMARQLSQAVAVAVPDDKVSGGLIRQRFVEAEEPGPPRTRVRGDPDARPALSRQEFQDACDAVARNQVPDMGATRAEGPLYVRPTAAYGLRGGGRRRGEVPLNCGTRRM